MKHTFLLTLSFILVSSAFAQVVRPIPYPVIPNPKFQTALDNGTRSEDGQPGDTYWMNTADYTIHASLSPSTNMLRGTEEVVYTNNSPDELTSIIVHLRQNLNKEGVVRNRPQKLTGGVHVTRVAFEGAELIEQSPRVGPGYSMNGTRMNILLPTPLGPGETTQLAFSWSFEVPERGAPRMGHDGDVYFVAYWFPQIAVYDDVSGWKADPYMGNGELYADYGDYTVNLTLPEGWIVGATGDLMNASDVLKPDFVQRLKTAMETDDVVHVVQKDERGQATKPSDSGALTWTFNAQNVRDFAFGTSASYVWDATRASTTDDTFSAIHALYRPDLASWNRSAEFARFTIEYLSDMFMPYPYPHMTTAEGVIGGGMEFPMITHIGGGRNDQSLFGVTFHEIGHMWFPMIVGQDEKQFTWMDEGLTSFNTAEGSAAFWDRNSWAPERQGYYRIAGTGDEVEPMRHGDRYPLETSARGLASYNKPAVALHALRGIVGQDAFSSAFREYANRWAFKHPQPYDLFNTFNDVLKQDLDWFWTTMFFNTWTLDQAISAVSSSSDGVIVTVEDLGYSPFPVLLRATYADGSTTDNRISVQEWLSDKRSATARFEPGDVVKIEIDPDGFLPDIDRANNVWSK